MTYNSIKSIVRWVHPKLELSLDLNVLKLKMRNSISQLSNPYFNFSVRNRRSTYSRFLPVDVTARGASVTSSSLSSILDGLLRSRLLDKDPRPSIDPLLLPRKRLPRSMVTYCKFRTVLCRQLYKALCIIDLSKLRQKFTYFKTEAWKSYINPLQGMFFLQ